MAELREKIADCIEPSLWEEGERKDALRLADAILAIPEIRDALETKADFAKYVTAAENNGYMRALDEMGKLPNAQSSPTPPIA